MITTSGIKPILFFLGMCNNYAYMPEVGAYACYVPDFHSVCEMQYQSKYRRFVVEQKLSDAEYEKFFQDVQNLVYPRR